MRKLLLTGLILGVSACTPPQKPLPPPREAGELVVITRNSPTTYYENTDGAYAGLEHDLVEAFARSLGLPVRWVVASRFADILPAVREGRVHFAAAGLTVTEARRRKVRFGPVYQRVRELIVCNGAKPPPKKPRDLVGRRLQVVAGTSYLERLEALRRQYPGLAWEEIAEVETEDLLARAASGEIDCTVADAHIAAITQRYYPTLVTGFALGPEQGLAWAFPKKGDEWLVEQAQRFFARIEADGTLRRLLDRYYGHVERLAPADVIGFLSRMNRVLPRYRHLFQQAQELTGIDWRLLAALAYQESLWDPFATSPTKVRGMMMLTEETADRLSVDNRLDPAQSILGGARYLALLKDMLPERIPEPDRTWIALAAYNLGYGHLEDARVLAQRLGLDPDAWVDVKATLPLLAQARYNRNLEHGYARGGEAVILAENVRTYYDILVKYQPPHRPLFSPVSQANERKQTAQSLVAPSM